MNISRTSLASALAVVASLSLVACNRGDEQPPPAGTSSTNPPATAPSGTAEAPGSGDTGTAAPGSATGDASGDGGTSTPGGTADGSMGPDSSASPDAPTSDPNADPSKRPPKP